MNKRFGFVLLAFVLLANHLVRADSGQFNLATNGIVVVHAHDYYAIPVKATNLSFVLYLTSSNVSVDTLVLSEAQLQEFNSTKNVNDSLVSNYSNSLINVFLTNQTRYVVLYSPYANAKVSYLVNATSNFTHSNETTFVGAYLTVPAYSSISFPLHLATRGSPFSINLTGLSTQPLSYAIRNLETGTTVFNTSQVTITNLSISGFNATFAYRLRLQPGLYSLNITSTSSNATTVYVSYRIFPDYVDPFLFYKFGHANFSNGHVPTGIASFGLYNDSGKIVPYSLITGQVVGDINLTSLMVNTSPSLNSGPVYPYVMSIQLNDLLVVINNDGSRFVYWPQNVGVFYTNSTNSGQMEFTDNIWNDSSSVPTLSNSSLISYDHGGVYPTDRNYTCPHVLCWYDLRNASLNTYTLPLDLLLIINETVIPGNGVLVQFGYAQNNATSDIHPIWFDNVELLDPNVNSAGIYLSGNQYTPSGGLFQNGLFYDSELVFVGGGSLAIANFTNVSARLGLYYYNLTSGRLVPYPSTYTFGSETGETSQNIRVNNDGNYAALSIGNPKYESLYRSPTAKQFQLAGDVSFLPLQNSTGTEPQPVTPTHNSHNSSQYLLYAVVAAVLLVAAYIVYRLLHARHTAAKTGKSKPINKAKDRVKSTNIEKLAAIISVIVAMAIIAVFLSNILEGGSCSNITNPAQLFSSRHNVSFCQIAAALNHNTETMNLNLSYVILDGPTAPIGTNPGLVLFNFTFRRYYQNASYRFDLPGYNASRAELQLNNSAQILGCISDKFVIDHTGPSAYQCTKEKAPAYPDFVSAVFGLVDTGSPLTTLSLHLVKNATGYGSSCILVTGTGEANATGGIAYGADNASISSVNITGCLDSKTMIPYNISEKIEYKNNTFRSYYLQLLTSQPQLTTGYIDALLSSGSSSGIPTTSTVTSTTIVATTSQATTTGSTAQTTQPSTTVPQNTTTAATTSTTASTSTQQTSVATSMTSSSSTTTTAQNTDCNRLDNVSVGYSSYSCNGFYVTLQNVTHSGAAVANLYHDNNLLKANVQIALKGTNTTSELGYNVSIYVNRSFAGQFNFNSWAEISMNAK